MWSYYSPYHRLLGYSFFITAILWVFPFFTGHYVDLSFPYVPLEQIPSNLIQFQGRSQEDCHYCPIFSPTLKGEGPPFTYQWLEQKKLETQKTPEQFAANLNIQPGGIWQPQECLARFESVIVVPYRNRTEQLQNFLQYMHGFLQRQLIHYRIVVVEQGDAKPFNRGRLLNIGFKESRKLGPPNICFIFHDVDLLPQNDYNIYACTYRPRHMYSAVDVFRYHLPYRGLAGGAFSILDRHFEEINGFSNTFSGWGGEDDDFSWRLRRIGLEFLRFDQQVARYMMMPHQKEVPSPNRFRKLALGGDSSLDGLSTLEYELLGTGIQYLPLHTHLHVL